ncbi:hypothetical protein GCU56_13325 [Geodermatophilus sabuli]|uniref:Uncharacterized protein n=1 Tax=Geodermatophilus sabuli TaxID=1564158 RepID=A0A7K3W1S9_9ACTN|nr:hypothetical protein [Geodermatophilus sabuli]NEK58849.1 hypothetical protein [Geodermatophilus sabuli]
MSLSTTPAPARTDRTGAAPAAVPPAGPAVRTVRAAGAATALGSAAWASCILVYGLGADPGLDAAVYNTSTLLFQVGLVALVGAQQATGAIGTGRLARAVLRIEHVLLGLAMLSTLQTILVPAWDDVPAWVAVDAFWPISMLGMFAIGIRIAIAGRWRGAARFWPLGAESWAPVVIPASVAFAAAAPAIAAGHLLAGYAALGVLLVLRPELTGARP